MNGASPTEPERLSRDAWINLLLVGGFYFFIKRIRYALWSTLGAVVSAGLLIALGSAREFAISRQYKPGEGLGVVFAMLFGSAVLAAVFCAALVWRNRRGKGI